MQEKINKLKEQEAKQLLMQLTELLKETNPNIYRELVSAIEMAVLLR
jgi:hypothetical protein